MCVCAPPTNCAKQSMLPKNTTMFGSQRCSRCELSQAKIESERRCVCPNYEELLKREKTFSHPPSSRSSILAKKLLLCYDMAWNRTPISIAVVVSIIIRLEKNLLGRAFPSTKHKVYGPTWVEKKENTQHPTAADLKRKSGFETKLISDVKYGFLLLFFSSLLHFGHVCVCVRWFVWKLFGCFSLHTPPTMAGKRFEKWKVITSFVRLERMAFCGICLRFEIEFSN